jgi:hypothetical protein
MLVEFSGLQYSSSILTASGNIIRNRNLNDKCGILSKLFMLHVVKKNKG